MKRINKPALLAQIPLALMQHIPMNQHQRPRLNLTHHIPHLTLNPRLITIHSSTLPLPLYRRRVPRARILHEPRPLLPLARLLHPHEPARHRARLVRPRREAEAPVAPRAVLERVPEADGGGGVGVEEGRVLVRRDGAADLGLLADDHALEDARVGEAEGARDGGVAGGERDGAEGRGELVQVVADLVDGALFGLGEGAGRVEGVWEGMVS